MHLTTRDPSDGEGTNQLHTWCSTLQLMSKKPSQQDSEAFPRGVPNQNANEDPAWKMLLA